MMRRLPERFGDGEVQLRRWRAEDAETLHRLVGESVEHLRPWMGWVADEPLSLEERLRMLTQWEHTWRTGGDVLLGIFRGGVAAGGCGLHRRIGPHGLEIGYWVHPEHLRRGVATAAAGLLADAALALPDIERVEIHHDKANVASAGVPRALGFAFVDERPDQPEAPAEVGIECRWRRERGDTPRARHVCGVGCRER